MNKNNSKIDVVLCVTEFKTYLNFVENQSFNDCLKRIIEFVSDLARNVNEFCSELKPSKHQHFAIIVYLIQYCSVIKLFRYIYINQKTIRIEISKEIRNSLCKRLLLLLENYNIIFSTEGDSTVGNFLNMMNAALNKITEIDIKNKEVLKSELNMANTIIEEVLCLSMSIAHVAYDNDNKIISAGCRSVLKAMDNIKIEIFNDKPNPGMCNLVLNTCSDALCSVEARVNIAVLRLCLRIFSEEETQIDDLYNFCLKSRTCSNAVENKKLNELISNFDMHMDRIFQISFFSIASSKIGILVAEIKNIISDFEHLESEMVPAFVAMTKDGSDYRKAFADTLRKAWYMKVKLLRKAVHEIIEPSAYCKLVYEELKQNTEELWQNTLCGGHLKKSMLNSFFSYTKELGNAITECIDCFDSNIQDDIKRQLKVVYKVLNELNVASDTLLNENSEKTSAIRIFKRCQILTATIKQLWLKTVERDHNNVYDIESRNSSHSNTSKQENNTTMEDILIKSKNILKNRSGYANSTLNTVFKCDIIKNSNRMYNSKRSVLCNSSRQHFTSKNENISMLLMKSSMMVRKTSRNSSHTWSAPGRNIPISDFDFKIAIMFITTFYYLQNISKFVYAILSLCIILITFSK